MFGRLSLLRVALAVPAISIGTLQVPLSTTASSPTSSTTTTSTTTAPSTTTSSTPAAAASPAQPLLGFYDEPAGSGDYRRLDAVERWQGRGHAVVGLYTNFDPNRMEPAFALADALWRRGNVPMISWMPWLGNVAGIDYDRTIADGAYDEYLRAWAARARSFLAGDDGRYGTGDDRRLYLRFAHEANGAWYPYSPAYGRTPSSSFVAMWRHVHDVFVASGIDDPTRLAWVFSVNNVDSWGGATAEALFPGDAYVDWIAVDGYNWGTSGGHRWESPAEVFGRMVERLRTLSDRPLAVTEVGATTDGATVEAKSQWIADYFDWARARDVRLTMWFNHYPAMWEIFGGEHGDEAVDGGGAYVAYRTATADPSFVVGDRSNPRLLTDAQFTGV